MVINALPQWGQRCMTNLVMCSPTQLLDHKMQACAHRWLNCITIVKDISSVAETLFYLIGPSGSLYPTW